MSVEKKQYGKSLGIIHKKLIVHLTADSNKTRKMLFKDVSLSSNYVLNAFRSMKTATDEFIVQNMIEDYCDDYLPKSDELAIAISCNVFEELGCPIQSAAPGERPEPIQHLPEHAKFAS